MTYHFRNAIFVVVVALAAVAALNHFSDDWYFGTSVGSAIAITFVAYFPLAMALSLLSHGNDTLGLSCVIFGSWAQLAVGSWLMFSAGYHPFADVTAWILVLINVLIMLLLMVHITRTLRPGSLLALVILGVVYQLFMYYTNVALKWNPGLEFDGILVGVGFGTLVGSAVYAANRLQSLPFWTGDRNEFGRRPPEKW
jgi:hypothetical protein